MALLSPVFNIPQYFDENGLPLNGGLIYAYDAGSFSVLKTTYDSEAGDVENTNPIVLNSAGQFTTAIWLTEGEAYNLVLTKADGTSVIKNFDDIFGIPVGSSGGGGGSTGIWIATEGATYLTTNSFSVTGNEVANFQIGNRVRVTLVSGYRYGTVTAVSFSSPNTFVTIAVDNGGLLDSSISLAEWSLLIANGRTVDASAVQYVTSITPAAGTVASALNTHTADIATVNTRVGALRKVWNTTGTNTITISPSPAVTSYTADQVFCVKFSNAATGAMTLNVNGVGALSLKQYDSSGTGVDPTITAGQISDVAYNGTQFILLDPLPATSTTIPHGMQVFGSNGTFTVPAGVYSIKVTCVGAGGGAGDTYVVYGGDSSDTYYGGGAGGGGAKCSSVITTTPSTSYSVGVGLGGATGTAGGSSSFGITLVIAPGGGGGGSSYPTSSGGTGGSTGAAGTLISPGGSGQGGSINFLNAIGGSSGDGFYGTGGNAPSSSGAQGYVQVEW